MHQRLDPVRRITPGRGAFKQALHCDRGFFYTNQSTLPRLNLPGTNPDRDVIVVAHDGAGTQNSGEHATQQLDTINDPLATVFKVKTGNGVVAAVEVLDENSYQPDSELPGSKWE